MEDFIAFIKENRYVAVMGGSNSGKTTLLKMTFKELQTQYVVLYCGTDDITGRSQENILKELVTDTYGADSYSLFQAIPSDKKVIIIDDLHRISPKHLNKFLRGIEDIFGTNGYEYRFASKNHLAYFVAKALNRRFHDTGDTTDLESIVRQSCFSINGDILLFMTYISDNVNIPRLLLEQAVSYVSGWTEFDLSDIGIKYLQSMPAKSLVSPKEDEKEEEIHNQAIEEEERDTIIETLDIYDYDETKIDELNNQLIRAFLQLKIIARNFSAFISILPGPVKKDYVSAMYQLPNKIFSQWAESIDNSLDYLVEEVIAWQEEPDFEGKKLSREDILRFFQEVSLNMLLNLYYVASSHGANDNTVDYLAQQNYISPSLNYRIERLMFWEKVDDYQAVIKEAEELCSLQGDGMAKNMTLAILRHMLVHSDKIIDRERRRISSKYFSPRTQAKILMDRQKSQKERGIWRNISEPSSSADSTTTARRWQDLQSRGVTTAHPAERPVRAISPRCPAAFQTTASATRPRTTRRSSSG